MTRIVRSAVCCLLAVLAACSVPTPGTGTAQKGLVFLTREGCVNTGRMRASLDEALRALGREVDYDLVDQAALGPRDPRSGYPTPTLLMDNKDAFGMPEPSPGSLAAT